MKHTLLTTYYKRYSGWICVAIATALCLVFQVQNDIWVFDQRHKSDHPWILITSHFSHFDAIHLFWNLAALWLMAAIWGEQFKGKDWLVVLAIQPLFFVPWLLNSEWARYAGLSGLLHGLFAYGLLRHGLRPTFLKWVAALVFVTKLATEQLFDHSLTPAQGWRVAFDAHLVGAVSGCLLALPFWRPKKQ